MRLPLTLMAVALVVLIAALIGYVKVTGLKSQPQPGAIETRVARAVRGLAIPGDLKERVNPIPDSPDTLKAGLEHFARYCAICHGNNGDIPKTPIGNGLFPKPPDMRASGTQDLTDGELFYIIDNGVRFTGMPAFGTGTPSEAGDKQIWQLVRFIRHLPMLTADEVTWMESLNPL